MFRFGFLASYLLASMANAEPVALKDGLGQGMLFEHRSNCYVLFPVHVHPRGRSLNLFTGSPQAGGSAIVYFRRAEADIAVGVVSGSARNRCTRAFSKLPRDVSRQLTGARTAVLERVNPQGAVERLAMRINKLAWDSTTDDADAATGLYQYLFATIDSDAGETGEVYQGTSGAFLYIDDTPVAMVVAAPDAVSVKALRIEEITRPLARWLASGSFGALQSNVPEPSGPREGLDYQVTEWSGQLADPELSPTGLASSSAPFRVFPSGKSVSFVMQLSDTEAVRVREVTLDGPSDTNAFATPRRIVIDVDRARPGRSSFQYYDTVEMAPGERLTIPMNTFARQLRVSIHSTWVPGLPIEISAARVFAPD